MIRRFFRHLWESILSLKRNGWMTIAAISSVTITLTLVGIFASVILNTAKIATDIENNVRINVFLRVDSTDNQETKVNDMGETVANDSYHIVYDQIAEMENIESITFSSKDDQLELLKQKMGEIWGLLEGDANPLYDTYVVDTTSPEYVKDIAGQIEKINGVAKVEYGGVNTENLFKLAKNVRIWGLVATVLLLFTAVFLISNTVRITIISRSREIQIMRLVGAKNSYIRGPFLLEGGWVGLLGAIVPALLVYFGYDVAYKGFNPSLIPQNLSMIDPVYFVPGMIIALFIIGIIIGSLGSVLSMRRYLKI
ncbi:permease-like cell division protein FtsX [Streptococcus moroccensis]|uniref:Cell division protein FtsX n=1 Tax=Streptococcus moroccensis TaxID=1451356 RepID=A0ABT9YS92_9STRE|nr:permease-like cell division protein FtsX [Streptococcus moroccensis]MDQ0222645.1 cell division transport system permease protein [Streptococcus moroccensis]